MKPTAVENIPENKIKTVKELTGFMKNKKTILIASIKNIPASQFQEIGKKLRGKAIVKVPKKNMILRAIEDSKLKQSEEFKKNISASIALLFSDLDSYDLAAELIKNKTPAKAKVGQIAPIDIEISAGPTDLVPGPAISELGALGIQIQIKEGKIEIKESKIIVKEGAKISQGAADIMGKLDIKPFTIGFTPLAALDNEKGIIYTNININPEEFTENLKTGFGKALAFAVSVGYSNEDTIRFLLSKALSHEIALEKLTPQEETKETAPEGVPSDQVGPEEELKESKEKPVESKDAPSEESEVKEQSQENKSTQTPEEKSKGEDK